MKGKVRRAHQHASGPALKAVIPETVAELEQRVAACMEALDERTTDMKPLPLAKIHDRAQALARTAETAELLLWETGRQQKPDGTTSVDPRRSLDGERYYLRVLFQEAAHLADYA
jgi:hypothetical protein